MYDSPYTKNYLDSITGLPRWLPIEEKTPVPNRGEPHLIPGNLVTWADHLFETTSAKYYHNKRVGTVLECRWCLADWMRTEGKEVDYFPEAVVLWNDGETTNTSQACLIKISEDEKMTEKKPTRDFDDGEGRKKSPAAPKK